MIEYHCRFRSDADPEYIKKQKEIIDRLIADEILKLVECGGVFKFSGILYKEEHDRIPGLPFLNMTTLSVSIKISKLHE